MTQRAMLCPRCRRLIGSNETTCSWCGASRASNWWRGALQRGGSLDGDWLVKAIITVNIAWYILSLVLSSRSSLFSPDQRSLMLLGATGTIPVYRFGRIWTLLSANYLHAGFFHILFNMMALRQIAPWVINEYGAPRMFVIYTLGGVCGFVLSCIVGVPFTIGASAAVCGLIGSLLYYGKSRGGAYGSAVYREVSGWVVGLVLFGLMMPGINNWGHGGGILGGIVLGMLLGYRERRPDGGIDRILALACAGLTVTVLGWSLYGALAAWVRF